MNSSFPSSHPGIGWGFMAAGVRFWTGRIFALLLLSVGILAVANAAEPPVIPIGLDAYRQWDRWPCQRIGERAYMRSTYDRAGGNEGADASHFLYQLSDSNNVTLDVAGTGVLCFVRYNHWHGSPWHYIVDGADCVVQETSTVDPNHPAAHSVFLPATAFPPPLAVTWASTQGADLSWVPIGFQSSFRMAYERTHYGTGYYIYDLFLRGANLSRPIQSWNGRMNPDQDVLDLINRSGTDISPNDNIIDAAGLVPTLKPGETRLLLELTNTSATIRKLSFSVPQDQAIAFGQSRLRVTWDGRAEPSIEAPVALFFGAGTLYNRDNREYLVKAFPSYIRYGTDSVELACFFPMPFFKSARVELIGQTNHVANVSWSVRRQASADPPANVGYFHATYRDHPQPEPGRDLVLLNTKTVEGGGDWSGNFVGTSLIFSETATLGTLEGDPRFFFDDSLTPQGQGTGTEEWGGGGDYWGGVNMTLPFAGHPTGASRPATAVNAQDKIESAYRFLLGDLMPFGRNAIIRLEHGGGNESAEHYQTVAFWYGAPAAALVLTDELKIGDSASERAHKYVSPDASKPYSVISRYEWGVDTIKSSEKSPNNSSRADETVVFPPETDYGRKMTGVSEFVLKLNPANLGVLLRRKLDYALPNQRAEIYVADERGELRESDWKLAGIWYLAGGNTCVYSNPRKELGESQHIAETSNRRFRDDEFLVPRDLTEGCSAIRLRVKYIPVKIPLFPGHEPAETGWSEFRYDAYCYVLPDWGREFKRQR